MKKILILMIPMIVEVTRLVMCGEYMYYDCEFVGNQSFSCYSLC